MKAVSLFFSILFFPFYISGMIDLIPKDAPSPYFDQLRDPKNRPGSPKLLDAVKKQLKSYANAKKILIDFCSDCEYLKLENTYLQKWVQDELYQAKFILYNLPKYHLVQIVDWKNYCVDVRRSLMFQLMLNIRELINLSIKSFPNKSDLLENKYIEAINSLKDMTQKEMKKELYETELTLEDLKKE